eukprot:SAG31_NODE_179_length_21090_cov_11.862871_12_plen_2132_part_00
MQLTPDHERLYRAFFLKLDAESEHSASWRQRFDDLSAQFLRRKAAAHASLQQAWGAWRMYVARCHSEAAFANSCAADQSQIQSAEDATFWSNKFSDWLFGSSSGSPEVADALDLSCVRELHPEELDRAAARAAAAAGWGDDEYIIADSDQRHYQPRVTSRQAPVRHASRTESMLRGCFRRWAHTMTAMRAVHREYELAIEQFETALDHWQTHVLQARFDAWRMYVNFVIAEVHHTDVVWQKVFNSFKANAEMERKLAHAVSHWTQTWLHISFAAISAAAVVHRHFRLTRLPKAFDAWRRRARLSRRTRRRCDIATAIFHEKLERYYLDTWQVAAQAERELRNKMMVVARRVQDGALFRALGTWLDKTQQGLAKKATIRKVLAYALHKTLVKVMVGWSSAVNAIAQRKGKLRWAATKLKSRVSHAALQRWTSFVHEATKFRDRMHFCLLQMGLHKLHVSFARWAKYMLDRQQHKRLFQLLVIRCLTGLLRAVLHAWSDLARERISHMVKVSRMLCSKDFRLQTQAFHLWQERTSMQKENKQKIIAVTTMMCNTCIRSALLGWKRFIQQVAENRQKVAKNLATIRNALVMAAFNGWHDNNSARQQKKQLRSKATQMIRRLLDRTLWSSFNAWAHRTEIRVGNRSKLDKVIKRLTNHSLVSAFDGWATRVSQWIENRELMQKAAKLMFNMKVYAAFNGWWDTINTRIENRSKVAKVVKMMQNATLISAFGGWRANSDEKIENRRKMNAVIKMMSNATVKSAFHGWAKKAFTKADNREKLNRVLKRLSNHTLMSAFDGWKHKATQRICNRGKVGRVLAWLMNALLLSAFNSWHGVVTKIRTRRQKKREEKANMRKAVKLMFNMKLSAAFNGWWDTISTRIENRSKVAKVVKMMRNALLVSAFGGWATRVSQWIENRELMQKAAKLMFNMKVYAAFNGWWDTINTRIENRSKVAKVVKMMRNALLVSAFGGWATRVSQWIENRELMQKAAKLMFNMKVYAAFNGWWDTISARIENRSKVAKVVKMMRNALLVSAFNSWVDIINFKIELHVKAKLVIQRMLNLALAFTFERWSLALVCQQRERDELYSTAEARSSCRSMKNALLLWHCNAREQRRTRAMEVAAMHWVNLIISKTFGNWYELHEQKRRLQKKLKIAVTRMAQGLLTSTLISWCGAARKSVDNRNKMQNFLRRLLNTRMDACFSSWIDRVDCAKDKRNKMMQALQVLRNRTLAASLSTWYGRVQSQIDARDKLASSLSFFRNTKLLAAINAWYDWCAKAVEDRAKVNTVLKRLGNRLLTTSMDAWYYAARKSVDNRNKMQNFLRRLLNTRMDACFSSWIDRVDCAKDKRNKMMQALQVLRNRTLAASLSTWYGRVQSQIDARDKLASSLSFFRNTKLLAAINAWYDWCAKAVEDRAKVNTVLKRLGNRLLTTSMDAWYCTVQTAVQVRFQAQTRALTKLTRRISSAAFDTWAIVADEQRAKRERCLIVAESFIRRATLDKLYAVYVGWSDWVYGRVRIRRIGGTVEQRGNKRKRARYVRLWRSRYLQRLLIGTRRTVHMQRAYTGWVARCEARKQKRARLKDIDHRLDVHALARAFDRWYGASQTRRRAREIIASLGTKRHFRRWKEKAVARKDTIAAKLMPVIMKLVSRRQHECFAAWRQVYFKKQELMGRCLETGLLLTVSRFFFRWYLFRCKARLVREAAEKVQQKSQVSAKNWAISMWKEAYTHQTANHLFERRIARRILFRWRGFAHEHKHVSLKLEASIERLGHLTRWHCFRCWRSTVQNGQHMRMALAAWLGKRVINLLDWALTIWHKAMVKNRALLWKEVQLQRIVACRLLSRHWRDWQRERNGRLAIQRMMGRKAAVVLRVWHARARYRIHQCAERIKALDHWRYHRVLLTFTKWKKFIALAARRQIAIQAADGWIAARRTLKAMRVWAWAAAVAARCRGILIAARLRADAVLGRQALSAWHQVVHESIHARMVLGVWLGRRVSALLRWSIWEWRNAVLRKAERARLIHMLRNREATEAGRSARRQNYFYQWRRVALALGAAKEWSRTAASLWHERLTARTFAAWHEQARRQIDQSSLNNRHAPSTVLHANVPPAFELSRIDSKQDHTRDLAEISQSLALLRMSFDNQSR